MTVLRWRRHSVLSRQLAAQAFYLGVGIGILLSIAALAVFSTS